MLVNNLIFVNYMTSKQANVVIALLLFIAVFLGIISFRSEKLPPQAPIYEYREITVNGINDDYSKHNTWMKEGWEPIFLLKTDGVDTCYLMRRPRP